MQRMSRVLMITATLLAAGTAQAGPNCAPRESLLMALAEQYAETPMVRGLINRNAALELYASPAGTWTLTTVGVDGQSCIVAVGTNLENVHKVVIPGVPG